MKARVVYREAEPSDAEKYRLWQAKRLIQEAGLEADAD